jgi:3-dehydro-L-gulonate 2-dehydrogenase
VVGGFDAAGKLTRDPSAIEASQRPLPIGYWKGSSLALILDLVASMLAAGQATHQIARPSERETKLSQVFIALNIASMDQPGASATIADQIIEHLQANQSGGSVRYPGQRVLEVRKENLANGIPVEPSIWHEVQKLSAGL